MNPAPILPLVNTPSGYTYVVHYPRQALYFVVDEHGDLYRRTFRARGR